MQRVGWIRMGALGDLLVGLASLREVIDRWPGAKVSVIGPKLWLEILEPGFWPEIDRVVVIERKKPAALVYKLTNNVESRDSATHGQRWTVVSSGDWTLRKEMGAGYDVIFNTRVDSPREAFPAFWARVPERWGAAKCFERFIYTHRGTHYGKDPLLHERDVPLLLQDEITETNFCSKYSTLTTRIENSPRIAKWRQLGLPSPRDVSKVGPGGTILLVNPTSSRREKAWPSQKFYELIKSLKASPDFRDVDVKVLGSPAETDWLNEVARGEVPTVQPANIGELFRTVAQASLLVTNTSSVQFIAASVATPVVTLMGRARPEIWGPLGPKDLIVRGSEPPDVDSLFEREQKAYESIAVETVNDAVTRQLHAIRK
ncbi:MAG: glycosyltransferase family 9 protein [Bdellovibrionales bacterium]|nr:glycosyltransferase family 9 protein [Bdellovibrionales bacterium]